MYSQYIVCEYTPDIFTVFGLEVAVDDAEAEVEVREAADDLRGGPGQ